MTIKEVEKLTGMTAKSIRLYESKGLIQIERDENNSYRNFSKENVKQLKFIKMLRYLDFSIQEIKELIDADDSIVKAAMEKKLDIYLETEEIIKEKKYLCRSIANDYDKENWDKLVEENIEFIEFTESEEYADMKKTIKELEEIQYEPFATKVFGTLMFLGPVLSLILNYIEKDYKTLKYIIPLSLISMVFITLMWKDYFDKRSKNKRLQKKKNKGGWLYIPGIIALFLGLFLIFAIVESIGGVIYEPENYLFTQSGNFKMRMVVLVGLMLIILIMDIISKISKNDAWDIGIIGLIRKHKIIFTLVSVIALYFAVTDVTYVTKNKIIYHSWNHPIGVTYSYSDVEEINTGYKGGTDKGDFYYKVNLGDRWINFDLTVPNPEIERYNETYTEIDEFDEALMKNNPKKVSSHENEEYATLDKKYIELFGRVIDRK